MNAQGRMTDRFAPLFRRQNGIRALAVVAVVAAVFGLMARRLLPPRPELAVVKEIVLGETLDERGILEAATTVPVELGAGGEIRYLAADGAFVRAGEVVARVDETEYVDRLQRRNVEQVTAEMMLDVWIMRRDQTRFEAVAALALASNRLQLARFELDLIERGLTPSERRKLDIASELRDIEYDEAVEALARERSLVRDGLAAAASVEDAERVADAARLAAEEAALERSIRTGPPREEDRLEAARTVARLQGEYERGQGVMARRLAQADARIAEAEARVAMNAFELARDSNQLARCVVLAPTSGIFRVRWFRDRRRDIAAQPIRPGVSRRELDRIADIVQPGAMRVMAMIHESDIASVAVGMPAIVKIPALGGDAFAATLVALGGVGRDRYDVAPAGIEPSISDVTVFNATLALHVDDARLRPGMSAMLSIKTTPAAPRLLAPRSAVGMIRGESARVALPDGRLSNVTGRLFGPRYFWVWSGLRAGDRVRSRFPTEGS